MPTDYDDIAEEYRESKRAAWRLHIEAPSFLDLVGDVRGISVLDLACGEGFYTRRLADAGAARVVGVDSSNAMVELAREAQGARGNGDGAVTYRVADVRDLDLGETFDLVTAAYLLNYAIDAADLLSMCEAVVRHLRPGGRFVAINANPEIGDADRDYRIYGFARLLPEGPTSGGPLIFRNYQDGSFFDVSVVHLDTATHEVAFAAAGFIGVRWIPPTVTGEGRSAFAAGFWDGFLAEPPITLLECRRGGTGGEA
jgi:SAM-dependent methyltransferase